MPTNLERHFRQEVYRRNYPVKSNRGLHLGVLLPMILLFVGMGVVYSSWVRQGNSNISVKTSANESTNVIEKPTPIELPPSGILQEASSIETENSARLRIFLRAPVSADESSLSTTCSDGENLGMRETNHRFVKVLDWQSNEVIATAFVRSGEMVEIPLPLGSYKLRYAVGTEWYGEEKMFGSPYIYEMTDRFSTDAAQLDFTAEQPGADIGAYCANGNLGTKRIKDDSLPASENTQEGLKI